MILIIGSTHDDILYFESVMTNKREEKILNTYPLIFGSIFNQEVVVTYDIYTSYISSFVASYIMQNYFIVLVFVVGKCVSFSKDVKPGEIAVSKRVILGDVDQVKEANVKLGQIPHLPRSLESSDEVIGYISAALEKRSFARYSIATFISSNRILDNSESIKPLLMNEYVLGHKSNIVFDCVSGGVFLASTLYNIPVVAIKVSEKQVDEPSTAENYIAVLKQYSSVGRAVVTCIGDIGRNDIMKE